MSAVLLWTVTKKCLPKRCFFYFSFNVRVSRVSRTFKTNAQRHRELEQDFADHTTIWPNSCPQLFWLPLKTYCIFEKVWLLENGCNDIIQNRIIKINHFVTKRAKRTRLIPAMSLWMSNSYLVANEN